MTKEELLPTCPNCDEYEYVSLEDCGYYCDNCGEYLEEDNG